MGLRVRVYRGEGVGFMRVKVSSGLGVIGVMGVKGLGCVGARFRFRVYRVKGLGLRFYRTLGLGCRVYRGLGLGVWAFRGNRVQGSKFEGLGL